MAKDKQIGIKVNKTDLSKTEVAESFSLGCCDVNKLLGLSSDFECDSGSDFV